MKTPDALARFHREVQAAARLEHQNIVIAYDADEANGTHFFVMQFVAGSDLSSVVKSKGPLPIDQAIQCVTQAARGLEFAHRQGVIHRDIKPANLLLDGDGTVKILDMGLARIEGETGVNAELTSTGTVMGTVDYMAPEQALSTKSADARSDIYSLGITLWYLLTGRAAYEGDSLMARLMAHANHPIPSLKGARPDVSDSLDSLFRRMIAKKPEDRFQSMTEVLTAIANCQPGNAPPSQLPAVSGGPSEESRFNELLGIFHEETSAGKATGPKTRTVKSTVDEVSRDAAATVTSARGDVGTDPVTLTSATKKFRRQTACPAKVIPWWSDRRWQLAGGGGAAVIGLLSFFLLWDSTSTPGPQSVTPGGAVTAGSISSPARALANSGQGGTTPATPASAPASLAAAPATPSVSATPQAALSLAARLLSPDEEWSPPVNLGPRFNSDVDDNNPRLSGDGLRLWFRGKRGLQVASRSSTDAGWNDPVRVELPAMLGAMADMFVSGDERTMMYATWEKNSPVVPRLMQRASRADPWPRPVAIETGTDHGGFPVLSSDRRTLLFNNFLAPPNTGKDDVCMVTRPNENSPWQNPVSLGPIVNSPDSDRPSWISDDGTVLLFHTSREDDRSDTKKTYRLYWTHRSSPDQPWVKARPLGIAASAEETQTGAILSPDGSTLYFESNNAAGAGRLDIWMSRRVRKPPVPQSARPKTPGAVETASTVTSLSVADLLNSPDYEWTPPESLGPVVNTRQRNTSPELSANELELWMSINGKIAIARRPDLASPFGPPETVGPPIERTNSFDSQPELSFDGLTLYFASNVLGPQHPLQIWSSVRPSLTAPFETPVLMAENINVPDVLCSSPSVTDDELVLIFASARTGGQGQPDLYEAKRARRTDPFGAVTNLGPTVNSPSIDVGGSISPDGLCLVFESHRPRSGATGSGGGSDLYFATRKSRDLPFEQAVSFGPAVNSSRNEHHPCLSRDGTTLLLELESDRGRSELHMSRRVKAFAGRRSP